MSVQIKIHETQNTKYKVQSLMSVQIKIHEIQSSIANVTTNLKYVKYKVQSLMSYQLRNKIH